MSTKTIEVVGWGSGWQIVGIRLGSGWDPVNSILPLSQSGLFQSFAKKRKLFFLVFPEYCSRDDIVEDKV